MEANPIGPRSRRSRRRIKVKNRIEGVPFFVPNVDHLAGKHHSGSVRFATMRPKLTEQKCGGS